MECDHDLGLGWAGLQDFFEQDLSRLVKGPISKRSVRIGQRLCSRYGLQRKIRVLNSKLARRIERPGVYQRARNLRQIGEVRSSEGNLAAALEAFNESLLIMERLAGAAPGNVETQIGLANSLFYVGFIHWQRGELREARTFFERVIPIVDQAVNQEPDNTTMLIERAYAHTNLGRVLELEGAYQEALLAYRAVIDVNQRLVSLQPGVVETPKR